MKDGKRRKTKQFQGESKPAVLQMGMVGFPEAVTALAEHPSGSGVSWLGHYRCTPAVAGVWICCASKFLPKQYLTCWSPLVFSHRAAHSKSFLCPTLHELWINKRWGGCGSLLCCMSQRACFLGKPVLIPRRVFQTQQQGSAEPGPEPALLHPPPCRRSLRARAGPAAQKVLIMESLKLSYLSRQELGAESLALGNQRHQGRILAVLWLCSDSGKPD